MTERDWLSGPERDELQRMEAKIRAGTRAYIAAGQALIVIRDKRLYRETHPTFEAYCRHTWGFSKARATQLIVSAASAEAVTVVTAFTPRNEAVARELAPLREDPEAQAAAFSEAVERHGPIPTAEQVREVVRPPGRDLRFTRVENAADSLRTLPAAAEIAWPTEPGDVAAMDDALSFLETWLPAARAAWREHKKALRAQGGKLRVVA